MFADINGKLHGWEAVVLLPFIDERRLLRAMADAVTGRWRCEPATTRILVD